MAKWDEYGEKFLELRAKGVSYAKISDEIPVSVTTLKKWSQDWRDKIRELSRARIEAFVEEQLVALEHRLQLRAEQIMRMRDALDGQDLSKLAPETLLQIYLRYVDAAGKDAAPQKVEVEVSNPLAAYERVLVQCLELPEGTTKEDIPKLAAELASHQALEKLEQRRETERE